MNIFIFPLWVLFIGELCRRSCAINSSLPTILRNFSCFPLSGRHGGRCSVAVSSTADQLRVKEAERRRKEKKLGRRQAQLDAEAAEAAAFFSEVTGEAAGGVTTFHEMNLSRPLLKVTRTPCSVGTELRRDCRLRHGDGDGVDNEIVAMGQGRPGTGCYQQFV